MVTLKDIAERVGVSITTVSRVLNGKGSISQETKDKVFQVMRELNYYPNEMARSLVNKNSHIIGLIVPYIDHPFFSALTAAIEEASSHAGYKLFLCISGGNQERELEQFAALQANNVAGVLVCTRDSHNMDELLNRRNIPLVSIERSIEGVPSVACDNYKGGVLAAQELLASGCKAPLLFGNRIVSSRIPAFGGTRVFWKPAAKQAAPAMRITWKQRICLASIWKRTSSTPESCIPTPTASSLPAMCWPPASRLPCGALPRITRLPCPWLALTASAFRSTAASAPWPSPFTRWGSRRC